MSFRRGGIALGLLFAAWSADASALSLHEQPKYAAIVIDAKSGEVLYNRRADAARHPASITKVMTLYLAFEAIQNGKLALTDRVTMSRTAAAMPPSKIGLAPGKSLSVDEAISILATKSANDVAVALAERLGGTEKNFASMMTDKAQALGMRGTNFANASGLPNVNHYTTARDIATLSLATMQRFPQHYHYFSQKQYAYGKQMLVNHNRLMQRMPEVDGIKTGYTVASGFTLAASAIRDGRRLVAVVLGGPSTRARDDNIAGLLNAGFDVIRGRALGMKVSVASLLAEPADIPELLLGPVIEQGSTDDAVYDGGRPAVLKADVPAL